MFRFNFVGDDETAPSDVQAITNVEHTSGTTKYIELSAEIPLDHLIDALPPILSYSPLIVPLTESTNGGSSGNTTLAKRDLYDARFQLIAADTNADAHASGALAFVDHPSDLVPGVYEGGLKTWECSLDLAGYAYGATRKTLRGRAVLELGCGTAVPTLCLLYAILGDAGGGSDGLQTEFHLQDYNRTVLELVTFPNVFLAWYMSQLSEPHRAPEDPSPDPTKPGELHVTSALTAAFRTTLATHGLCVRFFAGEWGSFVGAGPYDTVLTAETVYRLDSLSALVGLLRNAQERYAKVGTEAIEDSVSRLAIGRERCLCLVAAKILYFGVGGGVAHFESEVQKLGGNVETMFEKNDGVGRRVMRVSWK